jgi:hypothetical protein
VRHPGNVGYTEFMKSAGKTAGATIGLSPLWLTFGHQPDRHRGRNHEVPHDATRAWSLSLRPRHPPFVTRRGGLRALAAACLVHLEQRQRIALAVGKKRSQAIGT